MMSIEGTQKERILSYVGGFERYLKSDEAIRDMKDRRDRKKYYGGWDVGSISKLDVIDIEKLMQSLWANAGWSNYNYLAEKLIADNGLDKLRENFYNLFLGSDQPEKRYARFINEINGMGPASVTELLSYIQPEECGIWNDKSRKALAILGFRNQLPLNKYILKEKEYKAFNDALKEILAILKENEVDVNDLLDMDYFLFEVWKHGTESEKVLTDDKDFDHKEIKDHLKQIGLLLGFEAETEKLIYHGTKVDVIWRTKIGNLGVVTYVFEIQRKGSIDSMCMNLLTALNNSTVQRVVAISDSKQLETIRKKVENISSLKSHTSFMTISDVEEIYENLQKVTEIIQKLELVKDSFTIGV